MILYGDLMKKLITLIGLVLLLIAGSSNAVSDKTPEQRIISYEINKSAGNMTGDDYVIALVYAYLQDYKAENLGKRSNEIRVVALDGGVNFTSVHLEAESNFPEYGKIYGQINSMMGQDVNYRTDDGFRQYDPNNVPQEAIDGAIQQVFNQADIINAAHVAVQARLVEEADQKDLDRQREEIRQTAELEREKQQHANVIKQQELDAFYNNRYNEYMRNVTKLNDSGNFSDAFNLSCAYLPSPYLNMMRIAEGDILMHMGRYSDAIIYYNETQDFYWDNNENYSIEDLNRIRQDFETNWSKIIDYKKGFAQKKLSDQIEAKKHDLRNAPNVKQLLNGHDLGRKYSIYVENDTFGVGRGYLVFISLPTINKPIDLTNETDVKIKVADDIKAVVPLCLDMFGALFADKRIEWVIVQNNETYLDSFGHKNEEWVWQIGMTNHTATKIGNWNDFKQYVGTDYSKLASVCEYHIDNRNSAIWDAYSRGDQDS